MIAHLRGDVEELTEESVIVDVGGVGYEVFVPKRVLASLPHPGSSVHLYTHDHIRDTDHHLFGFPTRDELDLFRLLLDVSGVGPKSALSLLSVMEPRELVVAVQEGDVASVARAQGVGRKTAQRVILDLQNKLGALVPLALGRSIRVGATGEAVDALLALGANETQAEQAVRRVEQAVPEDTPAAELVKLALRSLSTSG